MYIGVGIAGQARNEERGLADGLVCGSTPTGIVVICVPANGHEPNIFHSHIANADVHGFRVANLEELLILFQECP